MTRLFGDEPDWMTENRVKANAARTRKYWLQEVFTTQELHDEIKRREVETMKRIQSEIDERNKKRAEAKKILKELGDKE